MAKLRSCTRRWALVAAGLAGLGLAQTGWAATEAAAPSPRGRGSEDGRVCASGGPEVAAVVQPSLSLDLPAFEPLCSPPPQCFTDRDCDRICGKKVGGECVVINSCYRECACYG